MAAPFKTAQKLAGSLAAGQTGCLRGGTYTAGSRTYVLSPTRGGNLGAPITIRSYPGERARLVGIVNVSAGINNVTLSHLTFEGTGTMNTIKIYANDVVVQNSVITNAWRGLSCLMLGSSSGIQAQRPIVRLNKFHACGNQANGTKDHAIYAANLLQGQIVDNVIYDSAAYAIQLYPNAQSTRFAHNVVDGALPSTRGGLVFGGDSRYASRGNVAEQNVIVSAQTYNVVASWGGAVGSGNIARNNCLWAGRRGNIYNGGGMTASANVIADPTFVNRAARDYRLKAGSRCLSVVGYDTAAKLAAAHSTTTTTTTSQQLATSDSSPEPTPPREPDAAVEPAPVPQPGPAPDPAPEPDPVPGPDPEPDPEPAPEPTPEPQPPGPAPEPDPDPISEPDPTTILEPSPDPGYDGPVHASRPDGESGPAGAATSVTVPGPAPEAAALPGPGALPVPDSSSKPSSRPAPKHRGSKKKGRSAPKHRGGSKKKSRRRHASKRRRSDRRGRAHARARTHARKRHAGRRTQAHPWRRHARRAAAPRLRAAGRLYEPGAGSLRSLVAAPMQRVWLAPSVSFSLQRSR